MIKNILLALSVFGSIIFGSQAQTTRQPFGFAVAGAEFGGPGFYPSAAEMDYYQGTGLKLIRFPISWERVQPSLGGPLDATQLAKLKTVVAQAKARNMVVLIDLHNYCRRTFVVNGKNELVPIGRSTSTGTALTLNHLTDFWKRMATEFANESSIWAYGLMNEPHNMDETPISWFTMAQACITEIRKIDSKTMISVAGDSWSSATGWPDVSDNLKHLADPSNNLIYEAHCYFDDGSSQTYSSAQSQVYKKNPNRGIDRVKPFVEWLHANHLRGFVGEFGVPVDTDWLIVLDNFMKYLSDNCVSGTYWAAGGAWGKGYDILLEPNNGVEKPQMAILKKYLYPTGCTTSVPAGPPGYTYSSDEYSTVPVSSPVDIAYGANGSYVYLYNQTSAVGCNTGAFGKPDPAEGVLKHCWVKEAKNPYTGIPIQIAGVVEAENYDKGGEGDGYHDTDSNNQGAAYRTDGADVGSLAGGGNFVGWTATGEWLEYTINVTKAGLYDFTFSTSSQAGGGSLGITIDGTSVFTGVAVPSSGNWNTYTSFTKTGMLPQGKHLMRVWIQNAGFNLDNIHITETTCTAVLMAPSNSFCQGGSLVLTANAGAAYKWFNGATQVGKASTYTATTGGSYIVEVTDAKGCKSTSAVKTITVNPLPVITSYMNVDGGIWNTVSNAASCLGGTIALGPWPLVSSGWSWTGPGGFTSTLRDPVITNLSAAKAGIYTAAYTDANGCKANPVAVTLSLTNPANCVTTNLTGINGPSCLQPSVAGTYTLVPETIPVVSINWWSNSGAVIVENPQNEKDISLTFSSHSSGTNVILIAGVNYAAAPWYREYTLLIKSGTCIGNAAQLRSVATPVPFDATTTVSLENQEQISSIVVVDMNGLEVYRAERIDASSFVLGNDLPKGMYIAHVYSQKGMSVIKLIKNN